MINTLYYLNRGKTCPPEIPSRYTNYLDKNNFLSEFMTSEEKEVARCNLGISDIVDLLNRKIDSKVIARGNVAWDIVPTEGHMDRVMSSHAINNTLLNYALRTELDSQIQQVWTDTIYKIQDTYNKIEEEINLLNIDLTNYIDELKCEFTKFTTYITLEFNILKEETNTKILNLENEVNTKITDLLEEVQSKVSNLESLVNITVKNLNDLYRELRNFVENQYENLYKTLYCEITKNIYTNSLNPLEEKMNHLEYLVQTFLQSIGGTPIDNKFGDNEYLTVNLKVLADAFDRVWQKLEEITGEVLQGIYMTVSPDFFISENGCTAHITAKTVKTNGIFEHIAFYIIENQEWKLIREENNIDYLEFDTEIKESTIIKCEATIMGRKYERLHAITHYNSFWLGSGFAAEDIMDESHTLSIENGMRLAKDIEVEDGEHIIIVIGKQLRSQFLRADLNGFEIFFTESNVVINNIEYCVLISKNTYQAGTYNIDING